MTTEPSRPTPQDAPAGQPWPHTEWQPQPASGEQVPQPPSAPTTPSPAAPPPPPQRRVIPAPGGPNWVLAIVGVLLMLAAGAAIAHLLGYRPDGSFRFGPPALIGLGAVLVLVGVVGSFARGRSGRSSGR